MDSKRTKILLDKINALYKSISTDNKNVSAIEKDLMKSYIQQFYESFLDMPQVPNRPAVEIIKPAPRKTAPPVIVKKKEPTPPPKPTPKPTPPPAPPKPKVEAPPAAPPPPPPPAPEPPRPAPAPPPKPKAVPTAVGEEMEELFTFNLAKELSEKLSQTPIKDIKKAMGLNERVLTQNELFGGDKAMFDLTLDTLNKLPDFDQAKLFLMQNAASKYKWGAKVRKNKAKEFIKLVKRRFS